MRTKHIKTLIIAVCAVVLAVIIFAAWDRREGWQQREGVTPTPSATATPTDTQRVYENEFIRLSLLPGWEAQTATSSQHPGAVNIRKGKYILYINPQAQQASGVEGGRFSEIAMGAPSIAAVITEHPVPPCAEPVDGGVYGKWQRKDLYVDANTTAAWCRRPFAGKSAWYFSYLTTDVGGYFNYYEVGEPLALVMTVAYDSASLSELPEWGSAELAQALDEVGRMVETMSVIKP